MSNNVMAQQLFLTLSAEMGAPGRFEASRLRLTRWWRERFAGQAVPVLDNGSGLSRAERSTAAALGQLLQQAHQGAHAPIARDRPGLAQDRLAARRRFGGRLCAG